MFCELSAQSLTIGDPQKLQKFDILRISTDLYKSTLIYVFMLVVFVLHIIHVKIHIYLPYLPEYETQFFPSKIVLKKKGHVLYVGTSYTAANTNSYR